MDAYEATRIVFNRIQSLDPENAAKIMGLLLIQDHGEKEMIRLAFGPETLLLSIIVKAKKELNLQLPSSPSSAPISPSPFHHHHHHHNHLTRQSSSWAPPPPLTIASPSWAPQPDDLSVDDFQGGGGQQDGGQIPFFDGGAHQHRSCSAASDFCLSPEGAAGFGGWKPCLYFARGFCKNGSSCRFLHGLPDDGGASLIEQQCQDLLLRSKNQRLGVSAAGAFPYSPTGAVPVSPSSSKCYFLQNEGQRAVVAAAAAAMMLGDESHKFMGRSRSDFAGMVNPGSRQIYLTFPADSTFREEDVSNYFSIYGPVQDVRIPYQQKRMFGFVTFVYPETVKLILAKGNPHFVCDARVLVKPYKEKGKVTERKQHGERGEFSNCTTPTGLDSRDPYDLNQLGARMMYNSSQEMMLRRKLEEQQQAAELQQAIELQGRRFMGLQLLDFKNRSLLSSKTMSSPTTIVHSNDFTHEGSPTEEKSPSPVSSSELQLQLQLQVKAVNTVGADKEECCPNEDSDFQESVEHNLPDSPFASPIKAATFAEDPFVLNNPHAHGSGNQLIGSNLLPPTSTLDLASFNSCYFQMPRFSPGHGAVGL